MHNASGSAKNSTRTNLALDAVIEREPSIDENVIDADCKLMRVVERRAVFDLLGAEDRNVRNHSFRQNAAISQADPAGGEACHSPDGFRQGQRVRGRAGRQNDEEPLSREFLGDGAAHAPAHTDRQFAVVQCLAMCKESVTAVRLPFGSGTDHDGDGLAFGIG